MEKLTQERTKEQNCRLTIVGHSYVTALERSPYVPDNFVSRGRNVAVSFEAQPGATFDTFFGAHGARHMMNIEAIDPHYIVVILGGNDIGSPEDTEITKTKMAEFYHRLKYHAPRALVVATQIELREYQPNNPWGAPTGDGYHTKRTIMNNFLRDLSDKDFMMLIGGPNNLDDLNLYRPDQVHLRDEHVPMLWARIENTIDYVNEAINLRLRRDQLVQHVGDRQRRRRGNVRDRLD